ncbi:MAG: Arc family DNA-binding protein [Oscillospiraceae bacterium]|nr:Arc family DNA-binding protein [Oscillospiraceae bacterium]
MENNEKHFGLRVDARILAKFRYVCGYHGRSANSQLIQLMVQFIAEYEHEHGKIADEDLGKKYDAAKLAQ